MKKYNDEEARRIAYGWSREITQDEYARAHGVTARTLRKWLKAYVKKPTDDDVRLMLRKLRLELDRLEAVLSRPQDFAGTAGAEPHHAAMRLQGEHAPGPPQPVATPPSWFFGDLR